MKTLKALYLITIALCALMAGAVIAAADTASPARTDELPASIRLTCANCEANGSNSFGYNTYLGQKALVTIEQTAQQKENAKRARLEKAGLSQNR
jgi:hypothetical protein